MSPRRVPTGEEPKPSPDADSSPPVTAERLAELERELAQVNSTYLRLAADFENYRRRKAQEIEENARYGTVGLLQALLPGIDNLARAVSHIPADAKDGLAEGLRLTIKQFEDGLASQGIRRIPAVGEVFNPRLHDAVLTVPAGEAQPGTVVAELAAGYQVHDRVVRPAQVSVAEAVADPSEADVKPPRGGASQTAKADPPEKSPN
ncbi:MAG: nucleotide exchange factor GrpE [Candidatus Dormiibacterota bacterium]